MANSYLDTPFGSSPAQEEIYRQQQATRQPLDASAYQHATGAGSGPSYNHNTPGIDTMRREAQRLDSYAPQPVQQPFGAVQPQQQLQPTTQADPYAGIAAEMKRQFDYGLMSQEERAASHGIDPKDKEAMKMFRYKERNSLSGGAPQNNAPNPGAPMPAYGTRGGGQRAVGGYSAPQQQRSSTYTNPLSRPAERRSSVTYGKPQGFTQRQDGSRARHVQPGTGYTQARSYDQNTNRFGPGV